MRILSGVQPTGDVHIGNYFGAFKNWAKLQGDGECLYLLVDLHSITVPASLQALRKRTLHVARMLLACGISPRHSSIFVQSHVPEHAELAWYLMCHTGMGELSRMTQYKDRVGRDGPASSTVNAGLFSYPVLMAADIALYDTTDVPVGEDQRQHLELARSVISRFNAAHGRALVVPRARIGSVGSRIMDLQVPTRKMSKSSSSADGVIYVLDSAEIIERKVRRAITDSDSSVVYDPQKRPGVSNLLELLGATSGEKPELVADQFATYRSLKEAVSEALIEELRPVRTSYAELADDQAVLRVLDSGAATARAMATVTIGRVREALDLLSACGRHFREGACS